MGRIRDGFAFKQEREVKDHAVESMGMAECRRLEPPMSGDWRIVCIRSDSAVSSEMQISREPDQPSLTKLQRGLALSADK